MSLGHLEADLGVTFQGGGAPIHQQAGYTGGDRGGEAEAAHIVQRNLVLLGECSCDEQAGGGVALEKLDKDSHSLAFEHEVKRKMMTKTLNLIMDLRSKELANSLPDDTREESLVKDGAVYRGEKS